MELSSIGSESGSSCCLRRLGRRPVRAHRRRVVRTGRGRLGAVVEPRTGVPPLPRQPLQGARQGPHRRGRVCVACWSHTARATGRWCSPSMRRRGTAATPSAALSGASTTRRRSTPPVNRSSPGGTTSGSASCSWAPDSWTAPLDVHADPAHRGHDQRDDRQVRRLVDLLGDAATSRCSCSTPATTRSPSATNSRDVRRRCCAASATTGSSTPTRRPRPNRPPAPGAAPTPRPPVHDAPSQRPGPNPPAS